MEKKRREMMEQQRMAQRPMERLGLLLYSLYNLGIMLSCSNAKAPSGVIYVMSMMVIICWIFHFTNFRDLHFRTTIVTLCMHGMLFLYVLYAPDIIGVLPYFCAIVVLVGLYSYSDQVIISMVCIGVVFFTYCVILGRIDFSDVRVVKNFFMQVMNIYVILYLIYMWVGKRNETTKRMQKTISNLREAEDSRDDFLANISHEIRTPINTICGISEILLQKEMPSDIRMQLYYIQTAGRNLTSVVSDILDFSELQSGKIEIVEEEYNISSTINDVIDMSMGKISEKEMELIVNCDATIPSLIKGDEKKIRRVILNLLDNAIKFTEEGCVSMDVSYRRENYGINLVITIRDTGIGMEAGDLEKLFSGFTQVDTRKNRKTGGVGLGLAISHIMVQKMGGIITIKSKPDQGTIVKVIIPQKVITDTPIVQLENKNKFNIGIYINLEEYIYPEVRDAYRKIIDSSVEQLQVRSRICMNLSELKRKEKHEKFTHIIVTLSEYEEAKEYFDKLSETVNIVVVLYREDEEKISNPHLLKLYKPFYVLPLVSVIKGSMRGRNNNGVMKKAKAFTTKDTKILVVDDNVMNLKVMEGILGKYKISVVTANSGKAALQVIEEKDFDLILMDHMMPEMDGIETLHRIRAMMGNYYRNVPVIALTANTIAGAREMFLEEGFTDFIEKPVETSVLERVLQRNLSEEKIVYTKEEDDLEENNVEENKEEKEKQPVQEAKEQPMEAEKETLKEDNQIREEQLSVNSVRQGAELSCADGDTIGDLDKKTGMAYCGGEENWLSILKVCGDTAEENKAKLKEFYETKNWKEYTILIHGVKSSMKTVGAMTLSEMAKALEQAGKVENTEYIEAHHDEMLVEYNRVDAFLHASPLLYEQTKAETEEKKEYQCIDEALFDEKIAQMEEAMYNFDGDAMSAILRELQEYEYGGVPLDKPLTAIIRKVEMTDYMSAYDTLVKIKQELARKSDKMQEEG